MRRDFLQKWKAGRRADGLVPMCFVIFHSNCLKRCACHEKVMPGHTKCYTCRLSRKITFANLKIWCSKMEHLRKSAPWLPNISGTLPRKTTSELSKVVRACGAFNTWLGNVLRAKTACTFWTCQLPKVLQEWCALYILTSQCASRHNGVQFFHLSFGQMAPHPSLLFDRRSLEKHNASRLSYLVAHLRLLSSGSFSSLIFFLLTLSLLWLFPSLLFHLPILSEVWRLNFPPIYIYKYININNYIYTYIYIYVCMYVYL